MRFVEIENVVIEDRRVIVNNRYFREFEDEESAENIFNVLIGLSSAIPLDTTSWEDMHPDHEELNLVEMIPEEDGIKTDESED